MKKVLSLVLVIAMAFSLVTIAGAASLKDYSDAASVTNKEAVNVLSTAGVLAGYDDGAFKPTENFTREQAAKVVCYLLLSPSVADSLRTSTSSFKDVAATRWSAPYIEYCVIKGIINGMGDGTFDPAGNVTAAQFAKMLLTALGYGKLGEYTGPTWEINAIVDAQSLGILKGNVDYSKAATREQVAQYALNALNLSFQVFSPFTNTYAAATPANTFAGKLGIARVPDQTVNGVLGHQWVWVGGSAFAFYPDEKVLATSTNGTPIADLTNPSSTRYKATLADSYSVIVNGAAAKTYAADLVIAKGDYVYNTTTKALSVCTTAGTGSAAVLAQAITAGDTVSFISSSAIGTKADKIAVTLKSVAVVGTGGVKKVAGINNLPDTVTVAGIITTATSVNNVTGFEGLVAGDVVTYYKDAVGVTHLEKATAVTGKVQAYNTAGTVTVNGTVYPVASHGATAKEMADYIANLGKDVVVSIDANGYAIWVAGPASSTVPTDNMLVLLNTATVPETVLQPSHTEALILLPDGTTKVVTVASIDINVNNRVYTYTVNAAGAYAMTYASVFPTPEVTATITRGAAVFAPGHVGNNATVFLVRSGTAGAYTYTSYTGIANVPTLTGATFTRSVADASGVTNLVYVLTSGTAVSSTNTVFFPTTGHTVYGETDTAPAYKLFSAVVGTGVASEDVKVLNTVSIATVGLYSVTYDTNGFVASATKIVANATGIVVTAGHNVPAGGIIQLGGTFYAYADTVPVYVSSAEVLTIKTVPGITVADNNDAIVAIFNSANALVAIYIVVV